MNLCITENYILLEYKVLDDYHIVALINLANCWRKKQSHYVFVIVSNAVYY